ncbi:5-formyltetrahydrofolate cyclo-ligase [Listeria fleischmannii]|nr:5-formyltetrahydrofolate cyclo-ligase [Listeria fleischmannii]EIA20663.1 5-formyltetrahydrofolate cyclo-ligase [Listeria fleischmannii subsp. coloradonensis]
MNKKELREKTLSLLNQMDKKEHKRRSIALSNQLFEKKEWQEAAVIGVTMSRFPEVDTAFIIEKAFMDQKIVAIPETIYPERSMQFRQYKEGDLLAKKKLGLKEPKEDAKLIPKDEIDLLIVPGVVYNDSGYRIGFGGGFYDRYLETYPNKTISLCFNEQLSNHLEHEKHDIPVDKILVD